MQSLLVVDNCSIRGLQGCFFDDSDRGDDWTDPGLLQALIRAHAHPACQKHLAIGDRGRHTAVGVLGGRIETVGLPLDVNVPVSAPAVRDLLTLFSAHDLPILDRQNDIVRCETEMLADGHAILGDCCDLQVSFSPRTACKRSARS